MKKIILTIAGLLPLIALAQAGYTISGKISGLNAPAKAYLALVQDGTFKDQDSVAIHHGKFQFKGSVTEPQQAIIAVKQNSSPVSGTQADYMAFFLENSKISINGDGAIKEAAVSGSQADQESRALEAAVKPLTNTIIKLNNEFRGKPKDEAYKKASDSVIRLVAEIKNIKLNFVKAHLNSFMGLYTYNTAILGSKFKPAEVEPLFHQFSPQLRSSALGKRVFERIETAKRGQAGTKVTDFTQNDIDGKPFSLSSLRGKYVLVDFWASWCAPCRAENPNVRKAYAQLKTKNFEIVSVSLDSGKSPWVAAIEKDGMPWIHVCDFKGWKNDVAVLYGVSSVPQNFLIDPNGVIIARDLRGEDLTEKLSALIK